MECFECGEVAIHNHHIIPRSLGGKRTVPLCYRCHCLAHGRKEKRRDNHIELTKEGLKRAKRRGVQLGKSMKGPNGLRARQIKRADDFAKHMMPVFEEMELRGITTLQDQADYLNRKRIPTAGIFWGRSDLANKQPRWHIPTVHRLRNRIENLLGVKFK